MTSPTIKEVQGCNDEVQLAEWVATACYGWSKNQYYLGCDFNCDHYVDDNLEYVIDCFDFNPCANTVEGRSQAFELMVEYRDYVKIEYVTVMWFFEVWGKDGRGFKGTALDMQKAIVKAAIMAALEGL